MTYYYTLKKKKAHNRLDLYWNKKDGWWDLLKIKNKDNEHKRTYSICESDLKDWLRYLENDGWYKEENE